MNRVPDLSDSEFWIIKSTLRERYSTAPDVQLAETELRLDLARTGLTCCPAAYWPETATGCQ